MRKISALLLALALCAGCRHAQPPQDSVTVLIESSPTNLDPRIGTDVVSQHIDELMFDSLLSRGNGFELQPSLAQSWEQPDALTYIFHIRSGVYFHNGHPLTARDVVFTLNSVRDGSITTAKSGAFKQVASVTSQDDATVIVKLKSADPALLWNLSSGAALGIVPAGSGKDFANHPIGTGPFEFVRAEVDSEVVVKRAAQQWQAPPHLAGIRFAVVPDAITQALELRKQSADISVNFLTPDIVRSLTADPRLTVLTSPGTRVQYLGFNLRDSLLKDARVRRAIALSINRDEIIHSLLGGHARVASSMLPTDHWAYDKALTPLTFDPAQANTLLDAAGYRRGVDGVRFHLTMKTSTDENARLLSAVLQQQMRAVGIALDIRSYEFATFYADVVRGAFQLYSLRWIGGNEDPDILRYAFATSAMPPSGANRGGYSNPQYDALVTAARAATTRSEQQQDYARMQEILAQNLPAYSLWYLDNVAVAGRRVQHMQLSSSGSFNFLRSISLAP